MSVDFVKLLMNRQFLFLPVNLRLPNIIGVYGFQWPNFSFCFLPVQTPARYVSRHHSPGGATTAVTAISGREVWLATSVSNAARSRATNAPTAPTVPSRRTTLEDTSPGFTVKWWPKAWLSPNMAVPLIH